MHLSEPILDYTANAFRYVDTELKPNFVVFTGDNNYVAAQPADANAPESLGLRRQRFLKTFLEENLQTPYVIIPGDNWPQDFDKIFGPKQYSFDYGGMHFIMLAPDRIYHGQKREGLSVFDADTWEWIERDLERNREQPTLVAIHEPIFPPTFLDAARLKKLLAQYPNVFVVLQGHLHVDLQFRTDGKTYLVAPSLEKPPRPGMKLVEVHQTGLVVRTFVYDKTTGRFEMQTRLQEIEIPPSMRSGLATPTAANFQPVNYDSMPARPLVEDPNLENRVGELLKNATQFLLPAK